MLCSMPLVRLLESDGSVRPNREESQDSIAFSVNGVILSTPHAAYSAISVSMGGKA